jgi:hypothetical protein
MAADVESDIKDWSTTASSNKPTGSTSISTNLDDNLREIQAAVRQAFEASPWFDYGHTYTYSDADTFTIGTPSTDQTSIYHAGRRVKVVVTGGTYYGYINSSSFATNTTTVNVTLEDSGALDAGLSSVWVGPPVTGNPLNLNSAPRVVGCDCKNNSSTPNTQFDLDADYITLRNPTTGHCFTIANPGAAITNNISTAGPAANGRDQAGAFSNSSWVHFYWIWNGTTLASLSSATAPPTGPTLPSGYTHWAYACSVYLNSSGALRLVVCTGNTVTYGIADGGATNVLTAGQQTTMTSIDCSALVPPVRGLILLHGTLLVQHTSASSFAGYVRPDGASYENNGRRIAGCQVGATNQSAAGDGFIALPNISQSIAYRINAVPATSGGLYLSIDGYTVPNGG